MLTTDDAINVNHLVNHVCNLIARKSEDKPATLLKGTTTIELLDHFLCCVILISLNVDVCNNHKKSWLLAAFLALLLFEGQLSSSGKALGLLLQLICKGKMPFSSKLLRVKFACSDVVLEHTLTMLRITWPSWIGFVFIFWQRVKRQVCSVARCVCLVLCRSDCIARIDELHKLMASF